MRRLNIVTIIWAAVWFFGFAFSTAHADIYTWTDENGIRVFTNYSPPENARLFLETPDIAYDEEAANPYLEDKRSEETRQDLVERVADLEERQKDAARRIAEREAYLQQRKQEAEARIAEADERAAAALLEAEEAREVAERASAYDDDDRSTRYIVRSFPYYGYRYRSPYYPRRHSLRNGSIHHRKRYDGHRQRLHLKKPFKLNHKNKFIQRFNRNQHISRQRFGIRGRHSSFQAQFRTFRGKNRRF